MPPTAHARRFGPTPDAARSRAQQADGDATDDSVINILVASDLHLGYLEKDPIRGDDSFATFNEVFQIANERKVRRPDASTRLSLVLSAHRPAPAQVDMVLLAGDLFHDNKPSRKALQRCMETLRDHCLGDREVKIEVVSDQNTNFHNKCVRHTCVRVLLARNWCSAD